MKNLDNLLKRAESFEKLATYSDRKTFLKALAQSPKPVTINANPLFQDSSATIIKAQKFLEDWKKQPKTSLKAGNYLNMYMNLYTKLRSNFSSLHNQEDELMRDIESIKAVPSTDPLYDSGKGISKDESDIKEKEVDIDMIKDLKSRISNVMQQLKNYASTTSTTNTGDAEHFVPSGNIVEKF